MDNQLTDLNYLKEVCNGDEARMQRYISMYLKSAPSLFEQMAEQLSAGDGEGLSRTAHGLKPQATYMGAQGLLEKLQELEHQASEEGAASCADLLNQCAQMNTTVIAELQCALEQFPG
jgi:HPt (histidine-containing phosphotransfer) domain-containing protein